KSSSEPERGEKRKIAYKKLDDEFSKKLYFFSSSVEKGIWRPDSLPKDAEARVEFFREFNKMSLKTLGLQLSEDTVAKVNGRIARSFDDAVE
ncbi:hypothetical protein, partial [Klebsiella pneumoniae]|uniref:hypothetical protein n=1 Tax=Klebsiella pneumoniae TaxID=573 RepID=UPI003B981CF6